MKEIKELERLLSNGEVTRRQFMARTAALGLSAVASPMLLGTPARAATPKKGGRLRIGSLGATVTDSLEPGTMTDAFMYLVSFQVRNCLTEIDHKGNVIPELATSFEPEQGAKKWIFKLRKGIEFNNGKTLEAQDVLFSINHHRGEKSKSGAKVLVETIQDIKADGKQTVIFELKEGNADFPYYMSSVRLPIMSAGSDPTDAIGTGGYKLIEFEPGVRSFATRNPNYWKRGRAHFDEIEVLAINDSTARMTALKTGRVDVINRADPKTANLLGQAAGIQLLEVPGPRHYNFPMLTDVAPYDNNDLRLALKYAIDREAMLNIIACGHGYIGNDHPIPKTDRFYASELPQRQYDPEKAKFHLKKAGLTGHTFKLHAADAAFAGAVDAAVLYREHAVKAGININVIRQPDDGYWSNIWMKEPFIACYWMGRMTADWMFTIAYAEGAAYNETHFKHERFNRLLKEARAELNNSKRKEMYVEMQRILRDEGGAVIPIFANQLDAASTKVKFDALAGNYEMDGYRCLERWWFAS